jgi:hypothetical protein
MEEAERIRNLKARLYACIPEHMFSIEQIAAVERLVSLAVDETVDMICELVLKKR